jgi:hypothetical protein
VSGPHAETGSLPACPAWCGQPHAEGTEHLSPLMVVLLPFDEQVTLLLSADADLPWDVTAELVHSANGWPATRPDEPNAIAWLSLPASRLGQLAGALSELAALAAGGTR